MNTRLLTGAASFAVLLAACGGQDSPAPESEGAPAAVSAEEAATGDATTDAMAPREPGSRPGRRGPMSGGMAEMHSRMMGGETGDAPEATAVAATAPACPDVTQDLADRGREIYGGAGSCFTCHGGDATGSQLAPDLTDGEWLNVDGSYGSIATVIRTGVPQPQQFPAPMPPMGGASLSPDQLCAVAAYVYSLSHR